MMPTIEAAKPWGSGLRQYLYYCTSSCVSICTSVLANLVEAANAVGFVDLDQAIPEAIELPLGL
jgi:hypothetical protein